MDAAAQSSSIAICREGLKAFDPKQPENTQAIKEWEELVDKIKTPTVITALNGLIKPGVCPPWLRQQLLQKLARVPAERPDGVRATLEFVASIHPSSTVNVSEAAVPQSKGANITQEALALAANAISRPARTMTPEAWYPAIATQLLTLLDGNEGPDLAKAAAYIIGFNILGKKSSGAPGTAGYKSLAEPMLKAIKPPPRLSHEADTDVNNVLDLSKDKTVVSYDDLATALHRLHALLTGHPNPNLCRRLLTVVVLPLWALAAWPTPSPPVAAKVCTTAMELLKIHIKLLANPYAILFFAQNLGYSGGHDKKNPEWIFRSTEDGLIQIVDTKHQRLRDNGLPTPRLTLEAIDDKISKLLDLISSNLSEENISLGFLQLFKKWTESSPLSKSDGIAGKEENDQDIDDQDALGRLVEIKVLQRIMERFPDKLATKPKHVFEFASQVLARSGNSSNDDDETTGVALSLLFTVITAVGFQKSQVDTNILGLIESSLDKLSKADTEISKTASNLSLLLQYGDALDPTGPATTAPTDQQIEDRKTYNLAVSYILDPESPPPVRSEGLNLISQLITAQSPILDIPGILVLLSSVIADAEEYVYLRVIKLYLQLCDAHPKSVVRELTECFLDEGETRPLDARLRFGEALLQVIQRLGETFAGPLAHDTGTALLATAGRRAHRSKTEARQLREAEAREKRNREAADAWGGDVPDLGDDEGMTAEEKLRNEALEQIVEGWESKNGSEDVRVRASALSILGAAVEVNVAGLGRSLVTGVVDLCIMVLQVEPEAEAGILRRAAVMFVLSFVKALDQARERGRDLGMRFGPRAQEDVLRVLKYVAETDNDGLVVQHAKDVMESLENWRIVRLLPAGPAQDQGFAGLTLTRLAGLVVNPESTDSGEGSSRPKKPLIEEVE
ncbi:hypothetical protein CHGG_10284 [Chaetomium globosum CBS 148.51]|uniref:RNA polymerase II assembly factor Rtp1 C-terminal domain-containing protein n=1 Tax=Chaetomium globosum (strain ATCC 6205 / CBS 148.51 / DSM 1962 / NBRC 6347 / NRRL 1970) TaxID=306901 RepID=Q2GP20_CHAGB|nr:uncharacterized protein CHGG_10284 [Chaetomium globosum CBS 148.51]EAQ83880.1 hypothetical protein CHGG_10284 [Chaetomium globosum CBS 148.51]